MQVFVKRYSSKEREAHAPKLPPAKFIATSQRGDVWRWKRACSSERHRGYGDKFCTSRLWRENPPPPSSAPPVWFLRFSTWLKVYFGHFETLTADQLPHAEGRGRGGGGGCGGGLVEGTLPVGHVEQAGLRGGWPGLTLLLDNTGKPNQSRLMAFSTNHSGQHDNHHLQ